MLGNCFCCRSLSGLGFKHGGSVDISDALAEAQDVEGVLVGTRDGHPVGTPLNNRAVCDRSDVGNRRLHSIGGAVPLWLRSHRQPRHRQWELGARRLAPQSRQQESTDVAGARFCVRGPSACRFRRLRRAFLARHCDRGIQRCRRRNWTLRRNGLGDPLQQHVQRETFWRILLPLPALQTPDVDSPQTCCLGLTQAELRAGRFDFRCERHSVCYFACELIPDN